MRKTGRGTVPATAVVIARGSRSSENGQAPDKRTSPVRQLGHLLEMLDGGFGTVGPGQVIERLLFIVEHRRERLIRIEKTIGVASS